MNLFKIGFITQLSLRDFVIESNQALVNNCIDAYNEYKKLTNSTILYTIKLVKERE